MEGETPDCTMGEERVRYYERGERQEGFHVGWTRPAPHAQHHTPSHTRTVREAVGEAARELLRPKSEDVDSADGVRATGLLSPRWNDVRPPGGQDTRVTGQTTSLLRVGNSGPRCLFLKCFRYAPCWA